LTTEKAKERDTEILFNSRVWEETGEEKKRVKVFGKKKKKSSSSFSVSKGKQRLV
jgi:hypothetical protein